MPTMHGAGYLVSYGLLRQLIRAATLLQAFATARQAPPALFPRLLSVPGQPPQPGRKEREARWVGGKGCQTAVRSKRERERLQKSELVM